MLKSSFFPTPMKARLVSSPFKSSPFFSTGLLGFSFPPAPTFFVWLHNFLSAGDYRRPSQVFWSIPGSTWDRDRVMSLLLAEIESP